MLLLVTVGAVVLTAVNRQTDSDAMGALLVSDSIVGRHTVFLDGYYPDVLASLSTRVEMVGDRPAYMFPIGTSLLSVPVVAVLRTAGVGVLAHDHQIQIALAAGAAVLIVLLMYLLARRFVGHWTALLLSSAFWFGSSMASTGATALWSHDFGMVLSLLALLLLVIALQRRSRAALPWLTATLALAVVVRPQLALLAVAVVVVLAVQWWRAALGVGVGLVVAGAVFLVANHWAYEQWLPGYYLPQRLEGGDFWVALAGNLVSPARGLLVYTPFLVLLGVFAVIRGRLSRVDLSLAVLGAGWLVVHLIAISRFPHWWGGWAFGPRLMSDVLPGLFLLTVVLWPRQFRTVGRRVAAAAFAALAVLAVGINTVQGLYNPYTRFWYIEPSVDIEPGMLWDWTYPQFLANEAGHEDRLQRTAADPAPITPGREVPFSDPSLVLVGWSTGFTSPGISLDAFQRGPSALLNEEGRRWTEGRSARILVSIDPGEIAGFAGRLRLSVDALVGQRVGISINGTPVYDGLVGSDKAVLTAEFDPALLVPGRNDITLTLPDASSVGQASDYRQIAIALKALTLE